MAYFLIPLFLAGLWPLGKAWWANRRTSLMHALNWAAVAWVSWGIAFLLPQADPARLDPGRYLALCLTGAAGVAVLNARQPYAGAWNFVVLGLLVVLVLPLAQNAVGMPPPGPLQMVFLAATLAVSMLNYLPTRFGPAVLLWAVACAGELTLLFVEAPTSTRLAPAIHAMVLLVPWLAFACEKWRRKPIAPFDVAWLEFRDRWGLFWGQRVREQFNRSAAHAGWPAQLYWHGLALLQTGLPAEATHEEMLETLRALLKRFSPE